jgi:hypothetical protein
MAKGKTFPTMKSKLNEEIVAALQQVVGAAVKSWLNENRTEVLRALSAVGAPCDHQQVEKPKENREPQFLTAAEVAARWQFHPESVRKMIRQGRLPRVYISRRILVPMSAIVDYERQGTVLGRGR